VSWDAYLDSIPGNLPLNRYAWRAILQRSYRVETYFFMALDDTGDVCGVLPTYATCDFWGNTRIYSTRFGLVADDDGVANMLLSHLTNFCAENGIVSALVTSGSTRRQTSYHETSKITMAMDLCEDENAEWRALRAKTRNMIRKAQRSDLIAERGPHNLDAVYDI
jgi:hypothetical protein